MQVNNEKQVTFLDMLPIDKHHITLAGMDGRQYWCPLEMSWFDDEDSDISPRIVYRTKPPQAQNHNAQ